MGRTIGTILGMALLAGGAIWLGRQFLEPAQELAEADESVLSGAYEARLVECRVLDNSEIPEKLPAPGVGDDFHYVLVVVLYPGREYVPTPEGHFLDRVDGDLGRKLSPVDSFTEAAAEGAFLELVFRADFLFDVARLMRGEELVLERVALE